MGGHTRSNLKRMARVEKINRYYDLEIRNLERTSRGLLLDTSRGKLKLGPTELEEGFLNFLLAAQQHLWAKGFTDFAVIHPSKEATAFIKYHGQVMVLEDQAEGEEFTYTRENIARGMETLARFHIAARGIEPLPGSKFKITWGKWPDRCFKEVNDLVRQKILLKNRRLSGFDAKFAEHADQLIERGLIAWQHFNHENYRKMLRQEMEVRAFNLHNFKAGNLKVQDGRVIIADMNRIRFEVQIYDLAHFLDEILEKSDLSVEEIADLTQYYSQIRPWSAEEHEALIAFLLYPKGLFRLIRHYYRNRRVKNAEARFDNLWRLLERGEELVQCLSADEEDAGDHSEKDQGVEPDFSGQLEDSVFESEMSDSSNQARTSTLAQETTILLDAVPDPEEPLDTPEASIKRLREVMGELLNSILAPTPSVLDSVLKVQSNEKVESATDEVIEEVADTYLKAHTVVHTWENVGDQAEIRDVEEASDANEEVTPAESQPVVLAVDELSLFDDDEIKTKSVDANLTDTVQITHADSHFSETSDG